MKRLFVTLTVLLALVVAVVYGTLFGIGWYLSPQDELVKSDAIVAISGGETQTRALEAIKLYREGWAPKLIFSGAASDPNSPSNAEAMRHLALKQGVLDQDIILDQISTNTLENAVAVSGIVRTHAYKQIILVTSPYHQRRASTLFKVSLPNVTIINHSAGDSRWRRQAWWANDYSRAVTIDELKKTLFVITQPNSA